MKVDGVLAGHHLAHGGGLLFLGSHFVALKWQNFSNQALQFKVENLDEKFASYLLLSGNKKERKHEGPMKTKFVKKIKRIEQFEIGF